MTYTAKDLEKMLLPDGWYLVRQVGSHRHYRHPSKPGIVTIPWHPGNIPRCTVNSILGQAELK